MYANIKRLVPQERIVLIHANLGNVEHKGVIEHIEQNSVHPLNVVKNPKKDFIDMVLLRGMFPSPQFRQCTSDLKQAPIFSFIRKFMKEHGYTTGFNCTGLRSEESRFRAMKNPLWENKELSKGGRLVYDWMPVFHLTAEEVFDTIYADDQVPHSIYGNRGNENERFSCVFCIMGCEGDLRNGAQNYNEHYHEMLALEEVVGHTMFSSTKTIRTEKAYNKGAVLEGYKVTTSKVLKRKVAGKTMYSTKVAVPVSLKEKTKVEPNFLKIQAYKRELAKRREALLARQAAENATKASMLKKNNTKTSKRDEDTLDWLDVIGA